MRSIGDFVPVRVWMSYESMARGKSVPNHPKCLGHMKQRAHAGLGVVLAYAHPGNGQLVRRRCTIENKFDLSRWTS